MAVDYAVHFFTWSYRRRYCLTTFYPALVNDNVYQMENVKLHQR